MAVKGKEKLEPMEEDSESGEKKQDTLLRTLRDVTSKEDWDRYFAIRGVDDPFEWYAEWPQLESMLTTQLSFQSTEQLDSTGAPPPPAKQAADVNILVPGCGNSKLSENLYDAGFKNITNVDFSKVVITYMLRRNVRERPEMKWRVMDMSSTQFANETFDAIVDKGGLDSLEPKNGPRVGYQYLCEVKRILKAGGKYICVTIAEAHILSILLPMFRFGWKMSFYAIGEEPSSGDLKLQTVMVVAEKDSSPDVSNISLFMENYSGQFHVPQARELCQALDREKSIRSKYFDGSEVLYSLEDLRLGAKGNLSVLKPGRRVEVILGGPGVNRFIYKAVLFDVKQDSEPFLYPYGVFIVPQNRTRDWLFASEDGQWLIVKGSKVARLLMVLLDSSNSNVSMDYIQMDLSPVVKPLAPGDFDYTVELPYMVAGDGIKQREIVEKVRSVSTGQIIVEDVIYQEIYDDDVPKGSKLRRLTFKRTENLVQSEALLLKEGSDDESSDVVKDKDQEAPKPKNKGKQRKIASSDELKVADHYLASPYHNGIIPGIMLISTHLKVPTSAGGIFPLFQGKAVVIGLGGGLLPMYMKKYLPSLQIEVIELDRVVFRIAKEYFGFKEDENLKVRIADGIQFVKEKAASKAADKVDILIVDVDSIDASSALSSPPAAFAEQSFLLTVKEALSEHGLFIINLVSRCAAVRKDVKSRLKEVFSSTFSLHLQEGVDEILFALKTDSPINEKQLSKARELMERSKQVIEMSKLIKPLK